MTSCNFSEMHIDVNLSLGKKNKIIADFPGADYG